MEIFYIDSREYFRFDYILGLGKIKPNEHPIIIPSEEPIEISLQLSTKESV